MSKANQLDQMVKRHARAGRLASVAMGKTNVRGEEPHDAAIDDPLAWWVLTEIIAGV